MTTSKTRAVVLFIITLVASCNAADTAKSQPLAPAILIFGDSTADTGNNNYHPNANFKANRIPYGVDLQGKAASGRFSNGKLYCEIIASRLHIKELVPPFLQPNLSDAEIVTGVSFASAGSGYDDRTMLTTKAIPVSYQPTMFKNYISRLKGIVGEKKAMEIINGAIVIVSAGTNDFTLNYYDLPTRRLDYPKISDYQNFLLKRLENFVKEIYNLGCRKMSVGGLSPVGCLPVQMTTKLRSGKFRKCVERENRDALLYNEKLQKLLPAIEASLPGSKIVYSNIYDPTMDMIKNPTKYGMFTLLLPQAISIVS
ncbi:GDSL esterase/lipase At2g30310 [Eutrema salsugineum]|uniref:GDSL esterase/lipase At2g30310 n=1 Tax=Eutrema salsugineum TaxID=72664 RepID=UPI000CECF5AC|nr:GDSL esterase/lipase At2g30310 [Eutrema salsugineum]